MTARPRRIDDATRLAPSPTGALHLGNARTFLVNWLLARQRGWRVILRIEDLDGPRVKPGAAHEAIDDLVWLGLDWDEGPVYQSPRAAVYGAAIDRLIKDGFAYPCVCSRREAQLAASAPHADDRIAIYPGTCRGRFASVSQARALTGREPALRFRVSRETVKFADEFAGAQNFDAAKQLSDFVIAKSDGTPAYQLAVVVDDLDMRVTHIVRGDDLLDSAARQILIYRALGMAQKIPSYMHLPLVVGPDGKRLAKRHGDTRLSNYRKQGVQATRVVAMLARWCGVPDVPCEITALELISRLDAARIPHSPLVFVPSREAQLGFPS
ncbi:MAG: tRNA glutamyl-Q(34) synthetase GluQRS [Tepidisphaeraceae bacterium]